MLSTMESVLVVTLPAVLVALVIGAVIGWLACRRALPAPPGPEELAGPVGALVAPLRQTLNALEQNLATAERTRVAAFAGLREQIGTVARTNEALRRETSTLRSAMKASSVRGRWGELQLERVVELAGLTRHADFTTQVDATVGEHRVRPDLVVHLAGGRDLVVDAKVPLDAYLEAIEAGPMAGAELLAEHARRCRAHVTALAGKRYWDAVGSPELVVMFIPAEPFLDAAMQADPELLEFALSRNVVLATPSSLVAMLRAVALAWRQHALSEDAQRIHVLGRQLADRIDILGGHFAALGSALGRSVDAFNSTVGSYNSRVTVTARRLADLNSMPDREISDQYGVDIAPRAVSQGAESRASPR
jgi:DNA recombination protein RmuC